MTGMWLYVAAGIAVAGALLGWATRDKGLRMPEVAGKYPPLRQGVKEVLVPYPSVKLWKERRGEEMTTAVEETKADAKRRVTFHVDDMIVAIVDGGKVLVDIYDR